MGVMDEAAATVAAAPVPGAKSPPRPTLSVLDQSPIAEGTTAATALRNSLDLARLADRLGYHRYWVAEHHGTPALACAAPEVLIGPIGAATERLRLGSGGVMLPHYSPFKVAETFSTLAGLYPGRIDLGLGRAPGTDHRTSVALLRDRRQMAPDDFPQQLAELLGYLEGTLPADHPFASLAPLLPGQPEAPEPWLLGSSPQSAIWAAEAGLPYCFADFINPGGAAMAARYQAGFEPSSRLAAPRTMVAAWVVCADTDEEAQRLATSHRMFGALLMEGRLIAVPTVETAERFLAERGLSSPHDPMRRRRRIVGAPATVRAGIEALTAEYGADEVMIVTITHDHGARLRSYELVAEAFGLAGATTSPTVAAAP